MSGTLHPSRVFQAAQSGSMLGSLVSSTAAAALADAAPATPENVQVLFPAESLSTSAEEGLTTGECPLPAAPVASTCSGG